jgi:mercuric ion binding protein
MKILLTIFALCSVVFASNVSLIKVEGMHCPLCTTAVKKAVKDLDGVEKVSVRLNTKEVTVTYDEKTNLEDILKAIKTTSYEGVEISTTSDKTKN